METLTQADIFFLISSISFVILWILVGILLYYLIRAAKTFRRIIDKIEGDVSKVGDITKEMMADMRGSFIWGMLTRKKRTKHKD